jgi:hypothetical protein
MNKENRDDGGDGGDGFGESPDEDPPEWERGETWGEEWHRWIGLRRWGNVA